MQRPRPSKQQTAIIAALRAAARPLRPDEILLLAQKTCPGLGVATVYRNLKKLSEFGLVAKVEVTGDPRTYYERPMLGHHHHFQCGDCERVFDLPACDGAVEALAPEGFEVVHHEVILFGLCPECDG